MNELQPQKQNDSCLDRGLLVSLRDGELSADEVERVRAHLTVCPDCSADERSMRAASEEVYGLLALLEPSASEIPEPTHALSALQCKLAEHGRDEASQAKVVTLTGRKKGVARARKPLRRSPWWIAVAAAAILALVLLPNAGALANEFLALFSVQQFQPVSIDPQSFRNGIGEDLQSFGTIHIQSDNMKGIQHPTQQQVEQNLNFKLLLPTQFPAGVGHAVQFSLINRANGTFTFNAAQARAYLAKTGQGNISIPPQLDGATYTITLDPGVIINYGNSCQSKSQTASDSSSDIASLGCSGGTPFYIVEMPSPVIQATGKASLKDLMDFVLSLPKLSPTARMLLQDVNLNTGAVPLPIPPQVQAQQVTAHGAPGVLMTDASMSLGAVVWQTHGIIYVVAAETSNSTELLGSANSLR